MDLPSPVAALAIALAALVAPAAQAAQAAPLYTRRVLADNLANPRGLLVQGNRVLVSEAGSGGPALPGQSNCILSGSSATLCSGPTGALGSWNLSSQTYSRLLTGLPSLAQASGEEGTGLADLTTGGPTGLLGVFGFGGDPAANDANLLGSPLFGQVVSIDLSNRTLQPRANLAAYKQLHNPDGLDAVSNPYAIQTFSGRLFATDAGGNTLLSLSLSPDPADGSLALQGHVAFPPISVTPPSFLPGLATPYPASAVPTGLTVNPVTNELLIAQFGGFPFVAGAATLFGSDGITPPAATLPGLTSITDVAADGDGNIYILEYADNFFNPISSGSIWRVDPSGARLRIIDDLSKPTSLALAPDGRIFVADQADGLQGQLLEYRPVPTPLSLLGGAMAWSQARRLRRRCRRAARTGAPVRRTHQ